jgi:hypothetical protein
LQILRVVLSDAIVNLVYLVTVDGGKTLRLTSHAQTRTLDILEVTLILFVLIFRA